MNRLTKLKKGDLATEAERLAAEVNWMPAVFGSDSAPADDLEDAGHIPATDDDTGANDVAYANASSDAPSLPMAA